MILKDAPHPDVSKTFVDWLLSAEGQRVIQLEAHIGASLRKDAPPRVGFSPPEHVLELHRIPYDVEKAYQQRDEMIKEFEKLFAFS